MTHTYFKENILQIKDTNIEILSEDAEPKIVRGIKHQVIQGKLTYIPKACPLCGTINENYTIIKNGTNSSDILLGDVNFYPLILRLKKQRFLCRSCGQTFSAKTSLVDEHCHISNLVKQKIFNDLSKKVHSMTDISQTTAVSPTTVLRVLKKAGQAVDEDFTGLSEHLCFDEFKSVKNVPGAMSFVYIDAVTHQLHGIRSDRRISFLYDYFMRFNMYDRLSVKTVTIDLYTPYRSLIPHIFPNAKIITDRFHVVQHLNRALNRYRIKVMKKVRKRSERDYRKLKRQWKLILKNRWSLDFEHYRPHRLYEGLMSEEGMVEYLLSRDPRFRQIYNLINNVKESIHFRDISGFKDALEQAKHVILPREVRTVFQTLGRWENEIISSLIYNLSNGPIEGIIHKIKLIKRNAYGFRNYKHLKYRIYLHFKSLLRNQTKPIYTSETIVA